MSLAHASGPSLTQGTYKGWAAWRIQSGPLELVLVPQVGGRIMSMQWRGHDLSFTQPEREGTLEAVDGLDGLTQVQARKREMGFPLWGGDKTWLAPQARWTDGVPFLDLDSGAYEMTVEDAGSGQAQATVQVRLTSPICRETGIRIIRTVRVPGTDPGKPREEGGTNGASREWTVTHELQNAGSEEVAWAPWSVTMVLRRGRVYIPTPRTSAYPMGVKAYPEEGESVAIQGAVVSALDDIAVIRCDRARQYKFGVDTQEDPRNTVAWMLGIVEAAGLGLAGYYKEVPAYPGRPYGHGSIAEVFNSPAYPYFEMELHGPVVALQPGERFELVERQRLMDVSRWPETKDEVLSLIE